MCFEFFNYSIHAFTFYIKSVGFQEKTFGEASILMKA